MLKNTRTMKMMLAAVAAVGLSLSAAQASATQTTTVFSGSACQASLGSINLIDHTLWGVHSVNQTLGTAATVSCPISLPAGAYVTTINMNVFDRNNGGTPSLYGTDFSCTMYYRNGSGVTYTGPTMGATSYYSLNSIKGLSMSTGVNVYSATLECVIPNQTPNGLSHILNYSVVWQ